MKKIRLIQLITFLAAFLLFQLELIIGKILLPHYGGSYLVWGACVVFFQAVLLLGYMFAHFVIQKTGIYKYRYLHLVLLVLPLLFFPGRPLPTSYSINNIPMVMDVFLQLLCTIGLVFFILSTMSIVWQAWLAKSPLPERLNPYALFSVSNLGSFAALFSYPVFFELYFDLMIQQTVWRILYILLIGLHVYAFFSVKVTKEEKNSSRHNNRAPVDKQDIARWLLFGAAGVIMFLSVTNLVTSEVAPLPLLWVLPLSIYLITFVLNFKKNPWCPKWVEEKIYITLAYSVVLFFIMHKTMLPVLIELILLLALLFHICMFCQYKLHKHKPADHNNLTFFYFIMALGGFLGGFFITWIIPVISVSFLEYLLGILIVAIALFIGEKSFSLGAYFTRLIIYTCLILMLWPLVFPSYNIFGFLLIFLLFRYIFSEFRKKPCALVASLFIILFLATPLESIWTRNQYVLRYRNYYGIQKVYEKNGARYFLHGTTVHGAQFMDEEKRLKPITYFSVLSPVGKILKSDLFNFNNIGIQGLGIGTLAIYSKPHQKVDFFELDPDVYTVATTYFSFLENAAGDISYIMGDARLSLDKVPKNHYDLFISDVFSGDTIPVHLSTKEAILKYREHLKDNGIILVHTSNRYIDHNWPLLNTAISTGAKTCYKTDKDFRKYNIYQSTWVAITWDEESFKKLIEDLDWEPIEKKHVKHAREWTDIYSNILPYIKIDELLSSTKHFQPLYW